ncbi:MAG: hypothetical protein NTU86_08750 [Burkholderiales bacterium]|nr:hypothetical protein [Burkholderiales bacterium]
MLSPWITIALPAAVLYLAFFLWWGGRGQPLSAAEIEHFFAAFDRLALTERDREMLPEIRELLKDDDGREFVMHNLVRYRPKALYPPGSPYGDSAVEADRRYGRTIIGPLLRYGNLPIFVARRKGVFVEPAGADVWHMVAMVRYRSHRDFLRFALAITIKGTIVHKWAAIEKTHVFPLQPVISLFAVRLLVALAVVAGAALLVLLLQP